MTDETQAAPDELEIAIKAEIDKESAPLETETEAEATQEGSEVQEVEASAEESDYVEVDNDKIQSRINKKHWEMMEAKREAEYWKRKAEEKNDVTTVANQDAPQAPKLTDFKEEDFDYDNDARLAAYAEKMAEFKTEQKLNSYFQEQQRKQQEQEAQRKQEESDKKFLSEVEQYAENHPSYYNDILELPEFRPETLEAVRESGVKIVHYLAKNPEIAQEVASLSPYQAAMKLGALGYQLNNVTKKTNVSKAPDPVETVSGSGKLSKEPQDMTMEEIMKMS